MSRVEGKEKSGRGERDEEGGWEVEEEGGRKKKEERRREKRSETGIGSRLRRIVLSNLFFLCFFRGSWENLRVLLRTHYYSFLIHLCSLFALIPSLLLS